MQSKRRNGLSIINKIKNRNMNKYVKASLGIAIVSLVLEIIHNKVKTLGSDFMFFILIVNCVNAAIMIWQLLQKNNLKGTDKIIALVLAVLPIIFLLFFILIISSMH